MISATIIVEKGDKNMSEKPTVLVVDDEIDVADEIALVLARSHEFNVLKVNSGEDAITKVSQGGIDVVLLDIKMPKMSGIEALKEIKKIGKSDIEAVMLTALNDAKFAWEAASLGASDYITKPFQQSELVLRTQLAAKRRAENVSTGKKWNIIEKLREFGHSDPVATSHVWDDLYEEVSKLKVQTVIDLPLETIQNIFKKAFRL